MTTTIHLTKTITKMSEFSRFVAISMGGATSAQTRTTGFGFSVPAITVSSTATKTPGFFSHTTVTSASTRSTASATVSKATSSASRTTSSSDHTAAAFGLTNSYKSNSAALSLAIGIPLGVVGLLLVAFATWYYLKKRPSPQILPLNSEFYNSKPTEPKNPYLQSSNSSKYSDDTVNAGYESRGMGSGNVAPVVVPDADPQSAAKNDTLKNRLSSMLTPIRFKPGPKKADKKDSFIKRMSRHCVFNMEEYTISPLFLKRFNLNKPMTPVTMESPMGSKKSKNSPAASRSTMNTQKELPKLPSLIRLETVVEDEQFRVIKSYRKLLNDEIDINIGEKVKLIKNHSDGWCLVKKGNETGMIPRLCIQSI